MTNNHTDFVKTFAQVGFSGVIVYAPASLSRHLRNEKWSSILIREGRLLLVCWDQFNFRRNISVISHQSGADQTTRETIENSTEGTESQHEEAIEHGQKVMHESKREKVTFHSQHFHNS